MSNKNVPEYLVIDLETTIRNRGPDAIGNFSGSPWHPENKIVVSGWINNGHYKYDWVCDPHPDGLVVGHNVGFDLHYLRKHNYLWEDWLLSPGARIWDTMVVEYILNGFSTPLPSLDYCATKYGGMVKNDAIKEYWNAGVDTTEIPTDELLEYLEGDVRNTELVFLAQYEKAKKLGMLNLIKANMDALLATIEMEYNGIVFDVEYANEEKERPRQELDAVTERMVKIFREELDPGFWASINPTSPQQLSVVLFGGEYSVPAIENVVDGHGALVYYKTGQKKGQLKTKKGVRKETTVGMAIPKPEWRNKNGYYKTNEDVIKQLKNERPSFRVSNKTGELLDLVTEHRKLTKDLSTYFEGYSRLAWPNDDNKIHPNINAAVTVTGRYSSSNPNMQNLTKDK